MENLERKTSVIGVVGGKATGKTFTTEHHIKEYASDNPETGRKGRKVLIFDINLEYSDYEVLPLKDVKDFTSQEEVEIRRVICIHPNKKIFTLEERIAALDVILKEFSGGLLVTEDAANQLLPSDPIKYNPIIAHRQLDLDIIFHVHELYYIPYEYWSAMDYLRIHHTTGSVWRVRDPKKIVAQYLQPIRLAELIVQYNRYENDNKYYHCYFCFDTKTIKGKITLKSLRVA